MTFPVSEAADRERAWATLTAEQKRERTLATADELFSRDGIDVAMPAVADAMGAGVGSLYRQFANKDDLVAALLVGRIEVAQRRFEVALAGDDPWRSLTEAVHETIDASIDDRIAQVAWDLMSRPDVDAARRRSVDALDALVERARAAGALREDASTDDLRMVFAAARAAEGLMPGSARRLAELALRGLAA